MNQTLPTRRAFSACPHDCPSTCALEVEVIDGRSIGRLHGSKKNDYTDGVICAKVARYAERIHNPNRLIHPLRRKGPKGASADWRDASAWERIGWDDALDIVAEEFVRAESRDGAEAVWPYYYAGTMGLVQRDGINRLRHAKHYSGQFDTICTNPAWTGFLAGTGRLAGADPREMAKSDCVVIWGTNAVATQVNVITQIAQARKDRGAKLVVIDPYRTGTAELADMHLALLPGTDGALACAVMHVLFKEG
jgi:anaerobic selenocysteine-containing dehydrogenase